MQTVNAKILPTFVASLAYRVCYDFITWFPRYCGGKRGLERGVRDGLPLGADEAGDVQLMGVNRPNKCIVMRCWAKEFSSFSPNDMKRLDGITHTTHRQRNKFVSFANHFDEGNVGHFYLQSVPLPQKERPGYATFWIFFRRKKRIPKFFKVFK